MKTRVMMLVVLMGLTTVVMAQPNGRGEGREHNGGKHEMRADNQRGPGNELNLTDMDAIGKNIEKMGAIKTDMEKIRTKQQLAVRAQLTEEQRLKFDNAHKQMKPGKTGERGEGGKRGHSEFSRL